MLTRVLYFYFVVISFHVLVHSVNECDVIKVLIPLPRFIYRLACVSSTVGIHCFLCELELKMVFSVISLVQTEH